MKKTGLFVIGGMVAVTAALIAGLGSGATGGRMAPAQADPPQEHFISGRNINMVSGTKLPWGDPWLQRQNEPSLAVSSRNPMHLLAGANDYRTIDMPDDPRQQVPGIPIQIAAARDAWLGVYKSFDGGQSWITTLLPGYPQDGSADALASPIRGYDTACDPCVRAGANGLVFYSGIAFNRSGRSGAVFVARYIDNNNLEKVRRDQQKRPVKDSFEYVDTKIIGVGTPGQFLDMPSIAVDIPRNISSTSPVEGQAIPNARVYVAYTVFPGNTGPDIRGKLYVARSANSGRTWGKPVKISEDQHLIQRAVIAIDPRDPAGNTIYVAYRRFQYDLASDAIIVVRSTNGGTTFSKPIVVATIPYAFDQLMNENRFRTNTYPTLAFDHNRIAHIAWAERRNPATGAPDPAGQARIVVSSSLGGLTWTTPQPVELGDGSGQLSGHQIMPSLTYAGGKLMLLWYDQRGTLAKLADPFSSDNVVTEFVEDQPGVYRQTLDVRAAVGWPGTAGAPAPVFMPSQQVSRYLYYFELNAEGNPVEEGGYYKLIQAEHNPINFPLFQQGTRPFIGDYIDLAPSPQYLPPPLNGGTAWTTNTDGVKNPPSFHAAWADNRDVRPPSPDWWGDWITYSPPNSTQDAADLGQTIPCGGDSAGKRNQNIYTASLTDGIQLGSPGNTKPLNIPENIPGGRRTFTVFVRNLTEAEPRTFDLSFAAIPNRATASFKQKGSQTTRTITIGAFSSAAVTVYVDDAYNLNGLAPVKVDVRESGTLVGYALLNPDPTNLYVLEPDGDSTALGNEDHTPHISDPKIWKYDLGSGQDPHPGAENPRVQNPRVQNSGLVNPRVQNAGQENPRVQNKTVTNENIVNSETGNPRVQNPRVQNTALTDMTWTVTNDGNTTSCFNFDVVADSWEALAPYFADGTLYGQLLVYRIHTTPIDSACQLGEEHHDELLVNVTNPRVQNPRVQNSTMTAMAVTAAEADPADEPPITAQDATFWLAPDEQAYVIFRVYDPDITDGIDFEPQLVAGEVEAQAIDTNAPGQDPQPDYAAQPTIPWDPDPEDQLPEIGCAPSPVALGAVLGADPADSPIAIWNAGGRILDYTVQDDAYWLTITPGSGQSASQSDEQVHTLAVDVTGLAAGTYPATITISAPLATNNPLRVPVTLTVYSSTPSLSITTTSIRDGVRNEPYYALLECSGGVEPVAWSVLTGTFPPGLALETTEGGTGLLIGTPTAAGFYNFTIQVQDALPQAVTRTFSLTIADWVARYNGPGNAMDAGQAVVTDPQGNIYVTGNSVGNGTGSDWATAKYGSGGNQVWLARYDGPAHGQDDSAAIAVDAQGNVFVAGDSIGLGGFFEMTTAKYDSDGNILWDARYHNAATGGAWARAIAVDATGYVYVTGYAWNGTDQDYITIKYDRNGTQLWVAVYDGPASNGFDYAGALAIDHLGNVYVTGYSGGAGTQDDYATVKYDSAGNLVWVARYDHINLNDRASAIVVEPAGSVFITGYSVGTGTVNDYATVKYDANGTQLWAARYAGPGDDFAQALAVDPSGNVFVTGLSSSGGYDFATVKYDGDGTERQMVRYDGYSGAYDCANAIAVDPLGHVYVTGFSLVSGTEDYEYATIRYDNDLAMLGASRYNGPANGNDQSEAVALDHLGNMIITGRSAGNGSGNDLVTVKYAQSFPAVLLIPPASLDIGYAGIPYAKALWAFGGSGIRSWFIAETGDLPPGLELDSSTGVISGTPTALGTYNFDVYVLDGALTASKSLSITVTEALPDLVVESLTMTPPNPTFDNPVTFTAVVRNRGIGPAGPSQAVIWVSAAMDLYSDIGPLAPGASSAPITRTYTFGVFDGPAQWVDVWADNNGTGDDIIESNESNNRRRLNFNVIGGLHHFDIGTISSPQHSDVPFSITITAKDTYGNTVTGYTGTNVLTAEAGTLNRFSVEILPAITGAFVNGVWTGNVTFGAELDSVQITTSGDDHTGQSNFFNVLNVSPATVPRGADPADPWGGRRRP